MKGSGRCGQAEGKKRRMDAGGCQIAAGGPRDSWCWPWSTAAHTRPEMLARQVQHPCIDSTVRSVAGYLPGQRPH